MGWEVAVVAFFNSKKVPVSKLHWFSTAVLATYAGSLEHSAVNSCASKMGGYYATRVAMSGSAGLSPSRSRKPEGSTLSAELKKERTGPVAGRAVLTAEIKTAYFSSTSSSPCTERLLSFQYLKSRASAH
jgi:hypothetical protein